MRAETILAQPPLILDQVQRQTYFDDGYAVCDRVIGAEWLGRLNDAISALVEKSRAITASDGTYDLEPGHTADNPRLRRVAFLDDLDAVFWEFCTQSPLVDVAADLLGPDVRFRECMINFKWSGGGQEVRWHQDIPFYPHTNLSSAQFLVLLDDVGMEQGPLQVVPGSHKKTIFDHYDADENWLGYIPDEKLGDAGIQHAVPLTAKAGSVTVHHCATVHGSAQNLSTKGRPTLLVGYNACDALPYTAPAYPSTHHGQVVRGEEARFAHHEPVDLRLPPDWSTGYTSIFAHQAKAVAAAE